MYKTVILFFVALSMISCKAQEKTKVTVWSNASFEDSGFSVDAPCELKRTFFKSFQEKPRPIRVFSYGCDNDGIKYAVEMKEHMDEFDEKRVPQQLTAKENYLPELFKEKTLEVVFLKKEDLQRDGFPVRTFEAEIGGKDLWREFILVNRKGVFNLTTVLIVPKDNRKNEEMESNFNNQSQRFFDSFHLK